MQWQHCAKEAQSKCCTGCILCVFNPQVLLYFHLRKGKSHGHTAHYPKIHSKLNKNTTHMVFMTNVVQTFILGSGVPRPTFACTRPPHRVKAIKIRTLTRSVTKCFVFGLFSVDGLVKKDEHACKCDLET